MTTETKLEFATREWIDALRAALEACLAEARSDAHGLQFSISERYTEVPVGVVASGSTGWTARITGGVLDFAFEVDETAEVFIESAYETVRPLARFVVGGDEERQAEYDAMVAAAIASGTLRLVGDPTAVPALLADLHDRIAARTA